MIQRFRLWNYARGIDMKPCESGQYVLYADHAAEVERLTKERDAYREEVRAWRSVSSWVKGTPLVMEAMAATDAAVEGAKP